MVHAHKVRNAFAITVFLGVLFALTACSATARATATPGLTIADKIATTVAFTPATPPSRTATLQGVPATSTSIPIPAASPANTSTPLPSPIAPVITATSTRSDAEVRQGIILFSAYQANPNEAQIVAVRPDGTGWRILGAFPGHPWGPKLSPDGKQVLFSSAAPVVAGRPEDLDLNGSGSPDIWLAAADGSRARRLTGAAGYNGWSWSPDGRWIAFASNRDGTWAIYKMTAAGDGLVRLTSSPVQDAWPSWTSDGLGIVFSSTRSDRAQLYRMDATGGGVRRLLTTQTTDTAPAIAPSGGMLAFSAQTSGGAGEIYVADVSGANARRLTSVGGLNTAPAWSPDGTKIVFVARRDGRSDLYIINADGSGLTQLTTTGENQRPDWGIATVLTAAPRWAHRNDQSGTTRPR